MNNGPTIPPVRLLVATPTHGGGMRTEYVQSLSNLIIHSMANDIAINTLFLQGSILHKLRNQLLAYFIDSGATHLLMVDDDVKFDPESVLRLLAFNKEFSGLAVPFKRDDEQANFDIHKTLPRCPKTGMIRTDRIGTSLILLRRGCVDKMFAAYPSLKANGFGLLEEQTEANRPLWHRLNKYYFQLFDWGLNEDGTICPEDFTFCDRWLKIGGEIFVDDSQLTGHVGTRIYQGRLIERAVK